MKHSKLYNALKALVIISSTCLAAAIALMLTYCFINPSNFKFAVEFKNEARIALGGLIYPFSNTHSFATEFAQVFSAQGINPLIFAIIELALFGLVAIAFIISTIIFVVKKKLKYLIYDIALFFLLIVVASGPSYGVVYYQNIQNGFGGTNGKFAFISLLILIFQGLSLLAVLATDILLIVSASKKAAIPTSIEEEADPEEQPVMPEDAATEEAGEGNEEATASEQTQESEIQADSYIPVVEPEPEPDPHPTPLALNAPNQVIEEPAAEPEPEPIPQEIPEERNNHVEVNVNNNNPTPVQSAPAGIDPNSLASLLREVVRDIVRDEIARNNAANQASKPVEKEEKGASVITGATFGGPLVVQYFNGGINGVNPAPAVAPTPVVEEEKKPEPEPVKEEPKVEEKVEEPAPVVEEVKEEVKEETAPEVVEAPAPVAPVEEAPKKEYERLTFAERLLQSEQDILDLYNELKNEILSYGVKSRISANGDTFRLHKKMYVRITVSGKSLKLYFALDPEDYKNSKIPVQNAGHKGLYAEIPLMFKVKSGLSVRRAKELIQDTMDKDGLEQGEVLKVNWAKELEAELASGKANDEDDD